MSLKFLTHQSEGFGMNSSNHGPRGHWLWAVHVEDFFLFKTLQLVKNKLLLIVKILENCRVKEDPTRRIRKYALHHQREE